MIHFRLAVRNERGRTLLHHLGHGLLLVGDHANLPELLVALLLLMRLKAGDVGCVAPLVVAVVAPDLLRVDSLLLQDNLVEAPLELQSVRSHQTDES